MIRRFTEADWPELIRMSLALFPGTGTEDHLRDYETFLAREDGAVFIATRADGTPAGFVQVGSRPYVDGCDTSPVGFIEAWFVDSDVRRTGIGRALLTAAEDWAVDRGYMEMGSDALLDNEVSHRAHMANGYVEVDRVVQFRKPLRAVDVSAPVREEIARRLRAADAVRLIGRLERTPLPLLDQPDRARDRDRVHLAILKLVERDFDRLDYHLRVAATDWRDTLVAAGM